MRLKSIELDDDELPVQVTVVLSIDELALLHRMIGESTHTERGQIVRGGGEAGSAIFDATNGIFNRFWDDGVQGYLKR